MAASTPIHAFPEFFKPILCTPFFPSHQLLSKIFIVEKMDKERAKSHVTMTHQSSERILAEPFDWTSYLLFSVLYTINSAMALSPKSKNIQ